MAAGGWGGAARTQEGVGGSVVIVGGAEVKVVPARKAILIRSRSKFFSLFW